MSDEREILTDPDDFLVWLLYAEEDGGDTEDLPTAAVDDLFCEEEDGGDTDDLFCEDDLCIEENDLLLADFLYRAKWEEDVV